LAGSLWAQTPLSCPPRIRTVNRIGDEGLVFAYLRAPHQDGLDVIRKTPAGQVHRREW